VTSSRERVVVVGVGVVSAIGVGREAFARALRSGASGVADVTLFDVADQKTRIAAEVQGLAIADVAPARAKETTSRSDALAILAADEALRSARLGPEAARAGVFVGTTTAGMLENEKNLAALFVDPRATDPLRTLLSHPISAPADRVAEALGLGGPRRTVCSACSSSAHAIAMARDAIRRGDCDVALAGGTDALCRLTYAGFNALGALDGDPCRPFDASRRGLNLGEAAAFLVLARASSPAGARGTIEIAGVGCVSEAHHITNPLATGEGARRAMELALADARVPIEHIAYVSAHGTGTPLNDPMECKAIAEVMGARAAEVWVSSTKSQVGHTLGAAGAVEAVASVIAMEDGFVPPTLRLVGVDPACAGIRHVGPIARDAKIDACLSNSFGFGGADVSLCLARTELVPDARPERRSIVVTGVGARRAGMGRESLDALAGPAAEPAATAGPDGLDPAKARRLDRLARLAADASGQALAQAAYPESDEARRRAGAAVGTMWGSLDASAAFMKRVLELGATKAMPADFPNLVLSSAAGHVSIFHALRGPSWTVSAFDASGLAAVVSGAEEIATGRADAMVASGVEVQNLVVDRVLDVFPKIEGRVARAEGAAAVLLEDEDSAGTRDAKVLARVAFVGQTTWVPGDVTNGAREAAVGALLETIAVHAKSPRLYLTQRDATLESRAMDAFGIESVFAIEPQAGSNETHGAIGAALATQAIARGEVRCAVVLQEIDGALWAIALTSP
jgi:3-oxoacyl-[acyl-carrier-protein] synthase II